MKIQSIHSGNIQNTQASALKKTQVPFRPVEQKFDTVSFSGKKAKKNGILKTLAASLGMITVLTGCAGNRIVERVKDSDVSQEPTSSSSSVPSFVEAETAPSTEKFSSESEDSSLVSEDFSVTSDYSFSSVSSDSCKTKYNHMAGDVGMKLLSYGKDLKYSDVEKEINEFFDQNGITNVSIGDISDSREMSASLLGAFVPRYKNLEYSGGTMYIGKPRNFSDENERIKYAEEVSHELTHVIRIQNDSTNQGVKGLVSDTKDMKKIFGAVNDFKQTLPVIYARNAAFSDYVLTSVSSSDYGQIIDNIDKYGMALYDKEIKINGADLKAAVVNSIPGNTSKTFEDTVNTFTDEYLEDFVVNYDIEPSRQTQMKKAMLSHIIFNYKSEAEAYRTSTAVEETALGIQGDSLSDFVPETYDEIVKVLEKKLEREY